MPIIDEDGRFLGRVNVVDALSVLLVAAVLLGGISVVTATPDNQGDNELTKVQVQTVVAPYVADAIDAGPVPMDSVRTVSNVTVADRAVQVTVSNRTATHYLVTMTVKLDTTTKSDGLLYFENERLYIGQEFRLDLGETIIDAIVIEL